MRTKIKTKISEFRINRKNEKNGEIIIKDNVTLDINKDAHIKVEGKIIIGASDWVKDNRSSGLRICDGGTLLVQKKEQIFAGSYISIGSNAILEFCGDGFVNHECNIDCNQYIHIGKGTIIAKQVTIRDSDNHEMEYPDYIKSKPVIIGEHCWIGMRACILKGVTIGDGAVIAAGAVVVNDIPPNTLAAGVPARVIKTNISWN